jgi:NAD(P)-dependent dehydrogenase (short-subunit alcohol dehydrogenase family)
LRIDRSFTGGGGVKKQRDGRNILLTGGASGIGAATAKLAVARGHRVVIADVNHAGAKAVAREIGSGASAVALDIVSSEQWEHVLDEVQNQLGRLDVLINNAAVVHTGRSQKVPIHAHQQTMDVNFMGPLRGMLAALPRFKQQGSGHFVTVCSMTAFLPFPGIASYAASKHALRAFHHALAMEERETPLRFTIIYPTSTETPMLEQEARSDEVNLAFASPSVTPEKVGNIILDAMEKRAVEVYMPPERARFVRLAGTNPRSLRKLVIAGEALGAKKLKARRAARALRE